MSDPEDRNPVRNSEGAEQGRRDEQEELGAFLSAALDGELEPGEREALAALEARHPELRGAFEEVDATLRALAEEPIADARLAARFAALEAELARRAASAGEATGAARGPGVSGRETDAGTDAGRGRDQRGRGPGTGWIAPAFFAAAAALVLSLIVPRPQSPATPSSASPGGPTLAEVARNAQEADEVEEEEALALALVLGLAEGASAASGGLFDAIASEDLEVVEQLELLEYLAARDAEGRG